MEDSSSPLNIIDGRVAMEKGREKRREEKTEIEASQYKCKLPHRGRCMFGRCVDDPNR